MYKKKSLYLILTIIIVILTITMVVSINYFYIYSSIKNDIENILKEIIGISLFVIIALFFTIQHFVIKPLFKIIETIKYSQEALVDSKNKLKLLLEMSPTAVRIAKNHGEKIVFANNSYLKLIGINLKELSNKNPKSYYLKESIYKDLLDSLDRNETIENKLLPLNINGSEIWVIASYMNIIYDGEKAVMAWFYDVTDKIQIQKQIEEQKNEFETIFNYSIDGLAIVDLESNFLEFNTAYLKMTGFTREELLKTSCIQLTAPEDVPRAHEALENIIEKGFVVNFEKTCILKDNIHVLVNMSMVLLPDKKRILLSIKDVTQDKFIESQSKLASMGEMIGNIAHQWRQPLSLISTIASGIKVQIEFGQFNDKAIVPDMDNIIKQTTYLSNTIDDFRNFIKNTNEKGEVQISNIIKKVLSIIHPSVVNHNITIIQNTKDDMRFDGYENQLIQALINILNNSKDALKEHVKEGDNRLIFIETKNIINGFILKIKDNAGGIPENVVQKIFEPYFTTKHKSVGTGIGLSITHQIITKHHNANITASNEIYEYEDKIYSGACFTITFNRNTLLLTPSHP